MSFPGPTPCRTAVQTVRRNEEPARTSAGTARVCRSPRTPALPCEAHCTARAPKVGRSAGRGWQTAKQIKPAAESRRGAQRSSTVCGSNPGSFSIGRECLTRREAGVPRKRRRRWSTWFEKARPSRYNRTHGPVLHLRSLAAVRSALRAVLPDKSASEICPSTDANSLQSESIAARLPGQLPLRAS